LGQPRLIEAYDDWLAGWLVGRQWQQIGARCTAIGKSEDGPTSRAPVPLPPPPQQQQQQQQQQLLQLLHRPVITAGRSVARPDRVTDRPGQLI